MHELKLLDTPAGPEFDEATESYRRYMKGFVDAFPELIEKGHEVDSQMFLLNDYAVFMRWGIRLLEYSWTIDHLPNSESILDVGSGVTVLPNTLSCMGYRVDALDPHPSWDLRRPEMQELYNDFYGTNVRYIHSKLRYITPPEYDEHHYNIITCISVLEHMKRQPAINTVKHMRRLLKPGGIIILAIDYHPGIFQTQQVQGGVYTYNAVKNLLSEHLPAHWDWDDLREQDESSTPFEDFWSSHQFEGCLHGIARPYLSLGVAWQAE